MLQKTTTVYAQHGMPLEADVYSAESYPKDTPVLLYFHPGGLVDFGRTCLPPWLAQVCYQRKWPLISPSYRLLPQTGANGLLEDAKAAYEFALKWEAQEGQRRRVIVCGASGGFFMAALIAHHVQPSPLAVLSLEGIATFRHAFFNSSTLLTPEPIKHEDVQHILKGPIITGVTPAHDSAAFDVAKLQADGSKNEAYQPPKPQDEPAAETGGISRGELYDYFTYYNSWVGMVGDVDPGFGWAKEPSESARRSRWPRTILLHGDDDYDVPIGVSEEMRDCIGADRVDLVVAKGQPHLFDLRKFIGDEGVGMDAVREAVVRLDAVVESQ